MRLVTWIVVLLSTSVHAATVEVKPFAERLMREVGAPPGFAVVVVQGDEIVLEEVYGLRDVEASLPVTRDTRFYIASSTKSFTAAAARLLAHEGKLDLDGPLSKAIPGLILNAPLSADRISVRDLLTHRSGFTNGAVNVRTAIAGNMSDEEIKTNLARWSQAGPIGFRYANAPYVVAGLAVEEAAKSPWQEVLRDRLFVPLGMTSTSARIKDLAGRPVAVSYNDDGGGRFTRSVSKTEETMHAAGGVYSTARDLGRWLIANLNEGRVDGKEILPRRVMRELHAPQVNFSSAFGPLQRFAYALGWNLADYEGDVVIHHFGGFGGAYAHVSFMPDRDLGVVVLSNGGSGRVADTLAYYIYDRLLEKPGLDAKYAKVIADLQERAKKARADRALAEEKKQKALAARPARDLGRYAGTYFSERLGEIVVSADRTLMAKMGVLNVPLFPEGGDKFFVDWGSDGELEPIIFEVGEDGRGRVLDWEGRRFERR